MKNCIKLKKSEFVTTGFFILITLVLFLFRTFYQGQVWYNKKGLVPKNITWNTVENSKLYIFDNWVKVLVSQIMKPKEVLKLICISGNTYWHFTCKKALSQRICSFKLIGCRWNWSSWNSNPSVWLYYTINKTLCV